MKIIRIQRAKSQIPITQKNVWLQKLTPLGAKKRRALKMQIPDLQRAYGCVIPCGYDI